MTDQPDKRPDMEPEHILQFFAYEHLPAHLQSVSKPFGELAVGIVASLPDNPERTVALRKLLESKDAAVRALVARDVRRTCATCGKSLAWCAFRNAWEDCSACRGPLPPIGHSGNA